MNKKRLGKRIVAWLMCLAMVLTTINLPMNIVVAEAEEAEVEVESVSDQIYTGEAITPQPAVMLGTIDLEEEIDYEYSYFNNVNVGSSAVVTVTFRGEYSEFGSVSQSFNIVCDHSLNENAGVDNEDGTHDITCSVCGETIVSQGNHNFLEEDSSYSTHCKVCNAEAPKCGENAYYSYDETSKTLRIYGSGSLYNSAFEVNYGAATIINNDEQRALIARDMKKVIIGKDITGLADKAFQGNGVIGDATNSQLETVEFEEGSKLTVIGDDAFYYCKSLSSFSMPDSVKTIGSTTFRECNNLSSVELSNNLETIGYEAFKQCKNLENVVIPSSVTTIEDSAFEGCDNLLSVSIPNQFIEIGVDAFVGAKYLESVHVSCSFHADNEDASSYWSMRGVNDKRIVKKDIHNFLNSEGKPVINCTLCNTPNEQKCGNDAYWILEEDNTLYIYGSGALYESAFYNASSQKYAEENNIDLSRWDCIKRAERVIIGKDITLISRNAFDGSIINEVLFEENSKLTTIDDGAFWFCENLKEISIPASVTNMGDCIFLMDTQLETVVLEQGCTQIGKDAFQQCENLKNIEIPCSVKNIGKDIFYGNASYEVKPTVKVAPGSVAETYMKENYPDLTVVATGNHNFLEEDGSYSTHCKVCNAEAPKCGENAYYAYDETSKTLRIYGSGSLYNNAFNVNYGAAVNLNNDEQRALIARNMKKVIIGKDIAGLTEGVFYGYGYKDDATNSQLETVEFEEGSKITVIDDGAFYACESLSSFSMPDSVKTIGIGAFYHCENLSSVTLSNNLETIGYEAFELCKKLENVVIPPSVTTIEDLAFNCCFNLLSVSIPNQFIEIKEYAFAEDSDLESIHVRCSFDADNENALSYWMMRGVNDTSIVKKDIHDFSEQSYVADGVCKVCEYECTHKNEGVSTFVEGKCSICNYDCVAKEHVKNTNNWLNKNATEHESTCSVCEIVVTGNHDFLESETGEIDTTKSECSLCHVKNIAYEGLDIQITNPTYSKGSTQTPTVLITGVDSENYSVVVTAMENHSAVGYTLTINGKNNYAGTVTKSWNIDKDNASVTVAPVAKTITYSGDEEVLVEAGETETGTMKYRLGEEGSFSVVIPSAINVGTYDVWYMVDGGNNYIDTEPQKVEVTITQKNIDVSFSAEVTGTYTYDGEIKTPAMVVKDDTTSLVLGIDYTVTSESVDAGMAEAVIKPVETSNYTFTEKKVNFEIAKLEIEPTVTVSGTYTYDGNAKVPETIVKAGVVTLVKDKDYEIVELSNNVNVGTASFSVVAKENSNYTFEKIEETFGIDVATSVYIEEPKAIVALVYDGKSKALVNAGNTEDGVIKYSLTEDGAYQEIIPSAIGAGTYTVFYKIIGDANHADSTIKSVEVTIAKATPLYEVPTLNATCNDKKLSDITNQLVETGFAFADDTVALEAGKEIEVSLIYTPSDSNYKVVEDIKGVVTVADHDMTAEVVADKYLVSKATCTEKATYYKSCKVCGMADEATFTTGELAAHDLKEITKVDATCTKEGTLGYYECKNAKCGKLFADAEGSEEVTEKELVIEKVDHTPAKAVSENYVAPTKVKDGSYDEVIYCSVCSKELERETFIIPKIIPEHTHEMTHVEAKEAGCETIGNMEYWYCVGCERYFTKEDGSVAIELKDTVIKAKGHTPSEVKIENESADGKTYEEVIYCEICKEELSRDIVTESEDGHVVTAISEKAATCMEGGHIAYWYDKTDDKYYADAECSKEITLEETVIEKLDHKYEKYVSDKNATCLEDGTKTAYCEYGCGTADTVADEDSKLAHKMTEHKAVSANCIRTGTIQYYICSECELSYEDEAGTKVVEKESDLVVKINPDNHVGDTVVRDAIEATCTLVGYTGDNYCVSCGNKIEDGKEVEKKAHSLTEHKEIKATCKDSGNILYYSCEECEKYFVDKDAKTEITDKTKVATPVDVTNHVGDTEVKDEKAATCSMNGFTGNTYCKSCGKIVKDGEKTEKLPHANKEVKDAVKATCSAEGYTGDNHCKDCGEKLETGKVIAKVAHTPAEAIKENEVKPTADKDGSYEEVTYCSVCKEELTREKKTVDATGDDKDREVPKTEGGVAENPDTGKKTFNVTIPKEIIYTGSAVTFKNVITAVDENGKSIVLAEGTDYTVTYKNNKDAGNTATMIIKGIGEYKDLETVTKTFEIAQVNIGSKNSKFAVSDLFFVAKQKGKVAAKPEVYYAGKKLTLNKDYTLLIQNAEGGFDAYDGKTKLSENSVIKVVGNKNFTGEKLIKVTFLDESDTRIMLNKASVKGVKAQTYTGKSIVLDMNEITVKAGGKTLIYGTDFTVSYVNNLNVGTATMIITAKEGSEFVGSKVVTFKINGVKISKAVAKLTVDGTEVGTKKGMEATYTGSAIEPKVILTLTDGTVLTEGKDFTVTYKKNRKKGTAQVIITGKGGFTGTKNVKFKIKN